MNKSLAKKIRLFSVTLAGSIGLWLGLIYYPAGLVSIAQEQTTVDNALNQAEKLSIQANNLYQQGKYAEAIPLAEQALEIRQKYLGVPHPATVRSLNNLAVYYESQGKYDRAESLYRQALDINLQYRGDNHLDTATSFNNLGLLYDNQGKYEQAETNYQQALTITQDRLGKNHPETAIVLNNLGLIYQVLGKADLAEPLLMRALKINQSQLGKNHPETANSMNNLGMFYDYQGKYADAELLVRNALDIRKEQLGVEHPATIGSMNNLATIYQVQGRYIKAEPLLIEALALRQKSLENNHPAIAISHSNLALNYDYQKNYEKAEEHYLKAIEIRKKRQEYSHPDTATVLNNLAIIYQTQENHEAAEDHYLKALKIRQNVLGKEHPDTANTLNNLAGLYLVLEKYTEAETKYQQALSVTQKLLGERHPYVAAVNNNLALTYRYMGNSDRAIKFLTKGIEIEEYNLAQNLIAGTEKQKLNYIATIDATKNYAVSLNLQTLPNNSEATDLAFNAILQRKGRILDFLTNSLKTLHQQTDNPQLKQQLDRLTELRTEYSNLVNSQNISKQKQDELSTEIEQLEDQLSRNSELSNSSGLNTLENVRQLIPQNYALVELIQYKPFDLQSPPGKRQGKPRYAAYFFSSQNKPQAIDLGDAATINTAVNKFRLYLQNQQSNIDKQLKLSSRELDELIMKPVRQLLGNETNILISPDGVLNLIPFEALVDENNQYLVENYNFTYLTSGRDLLRITAKDKSSPQQPGIILADPIYSREGETVSLENALAQRSFDLAQQNFSRLPGTAEEAQAISPLFPDALVLTRDRATENALKQVKQPHFLHLATHGFFKDKTENEKDAVNDNPLLRSGLVFAGVKKRSSAGDDGTLTALEAATLNLRGTKLVVLSACDTGIGDVTNGEGIYGLRRAFVLAGSESQLISLWKVDDIATQKLMVKYYQRIKNNEGRSLALHNVQRKMLKSKDYQHPYYWASFIPSGDWSEMSARK